MRHVLNKILLPFRYRIQKLRYFDIQLERLAARFGAPKFVQIGANDGVRFDGLYTFVTEHHCPGLVVEPLPDMFERLRANYQDYPAVIAVNVAVHPTASSAAIYRVDPTRIGDLPSWAAGIASFDPRHHERSGIPASAIVEQSVPCRPLMELLEDHGMLDAALVQIDTEGFDGEVIRMIDFGRFRPLLIKYEHKHLPANDQVAIAAIFAGHGYRLVVEGSDTVASLPGQF